MDLLSGQFVRGLGFNLFVLAAILFLLLIGSFIAAIKNKFRNRTYNWILAIIVLAFLFLLLR